MPTPTLAEVLRYLATGDESLFFAIVDNPVGIVETITPAWVRASLARADDQATARLFHLLQDIKNQPGIESLLLALMGDREFQNWKAASTALFYNRTDDTRFDHGAVAERLQLNGLSERALYWSHLKDGVV